MYVLVCEGCVASHVSRRVSEIHEELEVVTPHAAPKASEKTHVVAPQETLFSLARQYQVSANELAAHNHVTDATQLKVGQVLKIPPAQASTSTSHTRVPPASPSNEWEEGLLRWPVNGVLYARFGKKGKEPHDGIDLAAPLGTPVKTAAAGKVLYAGEQRGYGLIVIVEHPNGLLTLYAHNRDLRVTTGQQVREEQVIATVGESGKTSGPHLHFEVRKDGLPVDPLNYLNAAKHQRVARRPQAQ